MVHRHVGAAKSDGMLVEARRNIGSRAKEEDRPMPGMLEWSIPGMFEWSSAGALEGATGRRPPLAPGDAAP